MPGGSSFLFMVLSVLATAFFWGVYGPLLHWGSTAMGSDRMRAFLCVGAAYVVVAVLAPVLYITLSGHDKAGGLMLGWTGKGIWWSFVAGAAGALGAFFLLVALNNAPESNPPLYVMPLVFGFAPVVNTVFAMWSKGKWDISPWYAAGLILVGVGAVTVLISGNLKGAKAGDAKPSVESSRHAPAQGSTAPKAAEKEHTAKDEKEVKEEK